MEAKYFSLLTGVTTLLFVTVSGFCQDEFRVGSWCMRGNSDINNIIIRDPITNDWVLQDDEKTMIENLRLNYIIACTGGEVYTTHLEEAMNNYGIERNGDFQTTLAVSPANTQSATPYQVWRAIDLTGGPDNPTWRAYVDSGFASMNRLYNNKTGVHSFLAGAEHQLNNSERYPWLQYICNSIHAKAPGVPNLVQAGYYTDIHMLFQNVPNIDIFNYHYYAFTRDLPYTGSLFQDALQTLVTADSQAITELNLLSDVPLHLIPQAHESVIYNYRYPTGAEILCEDNIALAYGAKALVYYLYSTTDVENGLLTTARNTTAQYDNIRSIHDNYQNAGKTIAEIGAEFMNLTWRAGYSIHLHTNEPIDNNYNLYDVQTYKPGGALEGEDTTFVELCILQDAAPLNHYMVINRRCDNNGDRIVNVFFQSQAGHKYRITNMFNDSTTDYYVGNATTFFHAESLGRGEAALLRFEDLGNTELSGTLDYSTVIAGNITATGNITVSPTLTLTVREGKKIYFENNYALWVQGSLHAQGTPGHRITFTSTAGDNSPSSWDYIRIVNTSKNSNLTYCNIYSASTGLVMENVTGTITIDECRVKNNSIGLLSQNSSGSVSIQNSNIEYNQTGVWLNNVKPSIKHTDIKHNSGKGLYLYNQSNVGFGYDKIYDNSEGIYADFNTTPSIYSSAGHNWIYDNSGDGVSGRSNSYPKLGFDILVKYGYNHIYSNSGYEVANYNNGGSYIMAERNYWSASETNPVPPQDTYGPVDWDPVLPPGPPAKSYNNNPALIAEVNEEYQQAADEYDKQIEQSPKSDDVGFAVSGLVRCYEKIAKSEIVGILDNLIAKYEGTPTEISAKELSLPFLLQEGSLEKGLERSEELLKLSQGTDR